MRSIPCLMLAVPALILLSVPVAGAAPPGRADYADQCAVEMGSIPQFNCMGGELLDITVNGASQTQPVANKLCDKPVGLGLAGNQCVPFSRLLRIDTGKPTVTTIAICRKYFGSNGPADTRFDDIAMIQHNKATGRTCFFQSKLEANLDGSTVPSPQNRGAAGSKYWLDNADGGPGGIPCTSCHAADPFIWSPFVAQKADLSKWDPNGRFNSNFAGLFGAPSKIFAPSNSCVGCHRFGRGPANDNACSVFPNRYAGHQDNAIHPEAFQMPPGFGGSASAWHASFDTALSQVARCCANPDLQECNSRLANDDAPDDGSRFAAIWVKQDGPAFVARHGLTSAQYQQQFDDLVGQQGLCLTDVSGYAVGNEPRFAAIWEKKSCPSFVARHGLTSAQYQQQFDQLVGQQGFRLKLVNGYQVGGQDFYAAIWEKTPGPAFVARHGMTSAQYQQAFDDLVGRQGFCLSWVSGYAVGNDDRYAAIWEKTSCPSFVARHGLTSAQYQQQFDQLVGQQGFHLKLVSGHVAGGQQRYAAIWEKSPSPAFVARHGLTSAQYQEEFDLLVGQQGFRLVEVSGY